MGWLEAVSGSEDDVPPDRRFYAGGGGSVRGYEYNSIYPLERDLLGPHARRPGRARSVRGSALALAQRLGRALFSSMAATRSTDWSEARDLRWGVGVGARYELGFAPLRIDIAVPLDRREGDEEYALYISLGQAF